MTDDDRVFKALADPKRRFLLDLLFERDGRTLTELYRHPTYHQASFTIESCSTKKYKAQVLADGELHARFPTLVSAQRWVAFMKGETIRL